MMKVAEAKQLTDKALDELAAALEQGQSEAMRTYLSAMSRFHRYSWGNVMLILAQRPGATQVAGYRTWKHFGRHVKRGEKGIVILAPIRVRVRRNARPETETESESEETDRSADIVLRFRAVHVFDISQTEGDPLPEPPRASGNPGPHLERLRRLIPQWGFALAYAGQEGTAGGLGAALGASYGGRIVVRAGLAPAEEFAVLAHELAHEMLHQVPEADRPPRTVRETEAEAVAYVVCEAVGLVAQQAAADYIALYRGDRKTLAASLDRIQRTAATILEALVPSEEPTLAVGG